MRNGAKFYAAPPFFLIFWLNFSLATRIKQVHEATKTDLKNKMASLVEMGERQHAKNRTVITKLQADVLAQRAVFWEGSKLRKFGQVCPPFPFVDSSMIMSI